jgi:hypothetical protein
MNAAFRHCETQSSSLKVVFGSCLKQKSMFSASPVKKGCQSVIYSARHFQSCGLQPICKHIAYVNILHSRMRLAQGASHFRYFTGGNNFKTEKHDSGRFQPSSDSINFSNVRIQPFSIFQKNSMVIFACAGNKQQFCTFETK